jgi:hypothetical protein
MGAGAKECTGKKPCRLIPSLQILGDFIRFMATCTSGWRTVGTGITKARPLMVQLGLQGIVRDASCVAAPGSLRRGTYDQPREAPSPLRPIFASWACESPGHSNNPVDLFSRNGIASVGPECLGALAARRNASDEITR